MKRKAKPVGWVKRRKPATVPTPVATPKPSEVYVPYSRRSPVMTMARQKVLLRSFQGGMSVAELGMAWGLSWDKVEAIIRRHLVCVTWPPDKPTIRKP